MSKDFETESFKFELHDLFQSNRFNIIQKSNNSYFGYIIIDKKNKTIAYDSGELIDLKQIERLILELDSSNKIPFFL